MNDKTKVNVSFDGENQVVEVPVNANGTINNRMIEFEIMEYDYKILAKLVEMTYDAVIGGDSKHPVTQMSELQKLLVSGQSDKTFH